MIKSLKNMRDDYKKSGVFYTPPELAEYLKAFFPTNISEIYDPTCGAGGLLRAFNDNVKKYGQDIDEEAIKYAEEHLKNFMGSIGNTLEHPAFMDRKFEYIVANPPFSISWNPTNDERFSMLPALPPKSKADYAFITHILHMLSDNGMAVILEFPGILYRGNSEGKIRKWLVENNYIESIETIDGNQFTDTKIATCCIVMKKNRTKTDITFKHNAFCRTVKLEEIIENNFNLSVSNYIDETPQKEEIDPIALEMEARKSLISDLDKGLLFSLFVANTENIPFQPFVDEIKAVVQKYDRKEKSSFEMP